jgi:multiple sugar transport system permease protein
MLLIMAGLFSIRSDLYEAARVDGAKWHHILRFLEIPSIRGIVLLGIILRIIDTLRFFDVVYVTTRGGPGDSTMVLTLYAYQQNFQFFQAGTGSAAAVIILVISIVITTFAVRLLRRIEND